MKNIVFYLVIIFLFLGCSAAPSESKIETSVAGTLYSIPTNTSPPIVPTNTPEPSSTKTLAPTNTSVLTNTPLPTSTPEATKFTDIDITRAKAKNFLVSQESGGVTLEVVRILIAEKSAVPQDFDEDEIFLDKNTVVEFIFRIVNNSGKTINLYVDQGVAAINDEQIDLWEYSLVASLQGDIGGEFLPEVTAIGGMWVGVKRLAWNEINMIRISINHPSDQEYNTLGPDYYFEIPVEDWGFEPLPEEIK